MFFLIFFNLGSTEHQWRSIPTARIYWHGWRNTLWKIHNSLNYIYYRWGLMQIFVVINCQAALSPAMYKVFGKYCPSPLFAQVFIVISAAVSVVSNRDERASFFLRRYCKSVQFNACTVTQLWFVYCQQTQFKKCS